MKWLQFPLALLLLLFLSAPNAYAQRHYHGASSGKHGDITLGVSSGGTYLNFHFGSRDHYRGDRYHYKHHRPKGYHRYHRDRYSYPQRDRYYKKHKKYYKKHRHYRPHKRYYDSYDYHPRKEYRNYPRYCRVIKKHYYKNGYPYVVKKRVCKPAGNHRRF